MGKESIYDKIVANYAPEGSDDISHDLAVKFAEHLCNFFDNNILKEFVDWIDTENG